MAYESVRLKGSSWSALDGIRRRKSLTHFGAQQMLESWWLKSTGVTGGVR